MTDKNDANNHSNSNSKNEQKNKPVVNPKVTDKKTTTHEMKKKELGAHPGELFNAKPLPKMQAKKIGKSRLLPSVFAFLVVVALSASSWTAYQQFVFNQNWQVRQSKLDDQIAKQNTMVQQAKVLTENSNQIITQNQQKLNRLVAKNQQLAQALLSTQEKMKALSGRQKQDWMLAEVAYLIKVAQLKLSLQKDKTTAIQMLQTADRQIIVIADNRLLPIREAIAKDLSNLSLVVEPDITGIALKLNAISQQIPALDLLALQLEKLDESINVKAGKGKQEQLSQEVPQEESFNFDSLYQSFLNDFIRINHHDQPVKPLITPGQRVNLNNNIQLAIQQAQIALVKNNEVLYQLNIANAIHWIDGFFKQDDKARSITKQLTELKSESIVLYYNDKLNAEQALSAISQQQLYRWLDQSKQQPGQQVKPLSSENKQ